MIEAPDSNDGFEHKNIHMENIDIVGGETFQDSSGGRSYRKDAPSFVRFLRREYYIYKSFLARKFIGSLGFQGFVHRYH